MQERLRGCVTTTKPGSASEPPVPPPICLRKCLASLDICHCWKTDAWIARDDATLTLCHNRRMPPLANVPSLPSRAAPGTISSSQSASPVKQQVASQLDKDVAAIQLRQTSFSSASLSPGLIKMLNHPNTSHRLVPTVLAHKKLVRPCLTKICVSPETYENSGRAPL